MTVLLKQSQGYDVKTTKKKSATSLKRKQLRHIYVAQSHATMTTQQRLEGPKRHLAFLI